MVDDRSEARKRMETFCQFAGASMAMAGVLAVMGMILPALQPSKWDGLPSAEMAVDDKLAAGSIMMACVYLGYRLSNVKC